MSDPVIDPKRKKRSDSDFYYYNVSGYTIRPYVYLVCSETVNCSNTLICTDDYVCDI